MLIADRADIALRVLRAGRNFCMESAAVYSVGDCNSPHVWTANAGDLIEAAGIPSWLIAGPELIGASAHMGWVEQEMIV